MSNLSFLFIEHDWKTPNTYDSNFKEPPQSPGVYLLVSTNYDFYLKSVSYEILYVGSSINLSVRKRSHEVLRMVQKTHDYVRFYFKETLKYREAEKELIKSIQPKFNTQWR